MSLIRMMQESGAIKESPIFSLKSLDSELENMRQMIKQKDVIIENNNEKIQELENYISELNEKCVALQEQQTGRTPRLNVSEVDLQQTLNKFQEYSHEIQNYEKFISKITADHEAVKEERNIASLHLANLEFAFADLVNKYERLKNIVIGYQQNQEALLDHIEKYKNVTELLQDRYESFKRYANEKLNEANEYVEKVGKKHISEMAKVKSKVLQSRVKISELEKTISVMSTNTSTGDAGPDASTKSVFEPLSSSISYH